jgi:hypothetical protein
LSIRASIAAMLGGATLALLLSGCSYDYLQHTDRVAYSAGDAVKANLESETINPSKRSMYNTKGLGKTGVAGATTTTTAPASAASTPAASATAPPAIN